MSSRGFTILSHGMLGYGFPVSSLEAAAQRGFELVAVDSGSTDIGPYYLGSRRTFVSQTMMARDLELIMEAARTHHSWNSKSTRSNPERLKSCRLM